MYETTQVTPETMYGPMLALSNSIMRYTGIHIPQIPFFRMKTLGTSWRRSLNQNLSYYKIWKDLWSRYKVATQLGKRLNRPALAEGGFTPLVSERLETDP